MTDIRRRQFILGSAASVAAHYVRANDLGYPNKPIRWIVTYPAGGGADWLTRAITERLRAILGQPILVDNRPGSAGAIGMNALAHAPADGYTVVSGDTGTLTMTPHLMRSLPYDPVKAFQPVSLMVKTPWIWVVNPNKVPAHSFRDFIDLAKKSPGKYTYGSFGQGSLTHVMTELLAKRTGTQLLHVPYKGAAPALQDLLAGQIDAMFIDYSTWKSYAASGRIRALGCSTSARLAQAPELPTLEENGVPKYNIPAWLGALVPAGTPTPIVERLRQAITSALTSPDLVRELSERAYIPSPSTPAQFQQEIKEGLATWGTVIKAANISFE